MTRNPSLADRGLFPWYPPSEYQGKEASVSQEQEFHIFPSISVILYSILGGDGVKQKLSKNNLLRFQNDWTG